jgi:hypothetical protein
VFAVMVVVPEPSVKGGGALGPGEPPGHVVSAEIDQSAAVRGWYASWPSASQSTLRFVGSTISSSSTW